MEGVGAGIKAGVGARPRVGTVSGTKVETRSVEISGIQGDRGEVLV